LGPYEIVAPLGAGGMGEVYRARDPRLGRDVAIKVLPAWAASHPDMLRRFEIEARAAGSLNHPGILSIHDIGSSESGPFIVSELLEGETVAARLNKGPLDAATVRDLGRQAADALAAAHDRGIVHRDLKPANLFITSGGRLKILDFGIARLMESAAAPSDQTRLSDATMTGVVVGTYGYMSPEQVNGLPVDHRSDIYSLGVVLYEMLSGRQAPAAQVTPAIETAALPGGDEWLGEAIRRCLAKQAADRFQSARDLARALDESAASVSVPTRATRRAVLIGAASALGLILAGVAMSGRLFAPGGGPPDIESLAVLPLANYSADGAEGYFADSMTEALILDLSRVSALTVTSRTSVMRYKGTTKPLRQIASELGVDGLVEASIQRAGDRIQISAKLVDARTDRLVWSDRYERRMLDILSLQNEIARAITREISVRVTPREQQYLQDAPQVDPAAHEAYLRGRYELNRFTESGMRKALGHFGDAIRLDPRSARAYAGLADTYSALRGLYLPPSEVMPEAKKAALKALELDDNLAEAHAALGLVLLSYDWDWDAAEDEFKRAIELNGGLASAHQGYALLLAATARPAEAAAEADRALRYDPLSPPLRSDVAWVYYLAVRPDRVIEHARKAVELEPEFWMGHTMLGLGYEQAGMPDAAIAALRKARSLDDSPFILEILGGLYASMGRRTDAQAILAELEEQSARRYVCAYEVATIYAGLDDEANTLKFLERGKHERADCMPWMAVDPKLDRLRQDPRFQRLLASLRTGSK
jgi:eukaryotic-like serine/threonine-protein kinase